MADDTSGRWQEYWDAVAWLPCYDGKARPAQSIALTLADGLPDSLGLVRDRDHAVVHPLIQGALARVPRLRGYGNAIVPEQAAAFITAALDAIEESDVIAEAASGGEGGPTGRMERSEGRGGLIP